MELDPALCYQAVLARDPRFDGRFFTAVRTTRIYCRPVCPALHPALRNCSFFPTAAAAQDAGYRPCLRCRPETAPGLGAWLGTSSTVARALALIDDGALDTASMGALAGRLGIGERQLRRLFQGQVGASPIAVAQTRRVLLAKQLIHETALPMTEIAHASGFGSLRRFHEVFHTLFQRPPATLRRARAAVPGGITLSLGYRPPYDWAAMLGFLATRAIPGVEAVHDGRYSRIIQLNGKPGSVTVAHDPGRRCLRATLRVADTAALPVLIARLRRLFDLEADPAVIGAALSRDPHLASLVAARPGLRVPGAWDGFELGVRAIVGQQITVAGATRLAGRIAHDFGTRVDEPGEGLGDERLGGLTHAFPRPEQLADAAITFMPRARAAAITALAVAADDPALFERAGSLAEGVARLCRLPGIGEWTAQYIAMRLMREPDAFPAADIGLMRAMEQGGVRPSAAALLARAEAWRPWRAYAALHLWTASPTRKADDALAA